MSHELASPPFASGLVTALAEPDLSTLGTASRSSPDFGGLDLEA
jgi:hypothetical protein